MVRKSSGRPATVEDVARVAEVSTATVSRVFTGKTSSVAPQTLQRVIAAANQLGYTPSEIGRSLRLSTTKVVALLVPDATNHFCTDVSISLEQTLRRVGLSMMLGITGQDGENQDGLLEDALGLRPHAIVVLGAVDTPKLRQVAQTRDRVVFLNRRPPMEINAAFVGIDDFAAGREVAQYFCDKGYVDCAVIHGSRRHSASRGRLDGFMAYMAEQGVDLGRVQSIESRLTLEEGYQLGGQLLRSPRPPRAILGGNDMVAYGVHRAAVELGARVPDDLAICGSDDNRINDWLAPWLTSVHIPALDFGPAIVSLLGEAGAGRREIILPFSLTVRTSA